MLQEAGALSHNRNNIHIYSNSWGPPDYGTVASRPLHTFTDGVSVPEKEPLWYEFIVHTQI